MKATFGGAALALASLATASILPRQNCNLPAVTSEGNAFWADGKRFYVRGVAYQPGGAADAADPMLDMQSFKRDVEEFKNLGINTIRIYTIDNSQNHDEAMALLCDAGIYLALDANTPGYSLNRQNIDSLHASYNDVYLQSVFATIDAFAGYSNLLLFFSGNEVINARNNTNAAPYIKAVTRDMKNYIRAQAPREIPVGYSSADVAENIEAQALYFACGEDDIARSDFFAFNDYSWCDPSSYQESGWSAKVETYSNYSLPLFLSEFGCITNTREWNEIEALYSPEMTVAYSGGLAYEYTLEANGYGLVEVQNGKVVPNEDFKRLQAAYEATPNPSGDGGARRDRTAPECPAESEEWQVATTLLPEMPEGAQKFFKDGAGTGPGLSDKDGSQWAGTPSTTEPDLSNGVSSTEAEDPSFSSSASGGNSSSGGDQEGSASSARPVAALTVLALAGALVMGLCKGTRPGIDHSLDEGLDTVMLEYSFMSIKIYATIRFVPASMHNGQASHALIDGTSTNTSSILHAKLTSTPPPEIVKAHGNYLTTSTGTSIFDATGGAAVACIGHGHPKVKEAIMRQLDEVEYCYAPFFTTSASENLAQLLTDSTRGEMSKVFIVSSGTEAIEASLKLARQYCVETGQTQRTRFIARYQSYHGNTLVSLDVGHHKARRGIYEPLLSTNVSHVSPCYIYRGKRPGQSEEEYAASLAAELDEEFRRVGPETVCALVLETVPGLTLGAPPPPPGYIKAMKSVCNAHGALLILDEVMCGMGRTGTLHAWEQEGVVPDLQTVAKGLGAGYQPIGALLIELVKDKTTKEQFPASEKVSATIHATLQKEFGISLLPGGGVADGTNGDVIMLAPAYNCTLADIELIVERTAKVIEAVLGPH
ncbi:1,3-beta-glucanosyltransferase gel1 [Fulvia fulva]|nr:1,3-beta-glucanosyltransferase gel1 [Fulvia fulva]WPV37638.1 1,3-beta-glucanosyltransferase gel1 [Fulvia fulva]